MQFVSGVGPVAYWVSSWLWDAALYAAVLLATLAVLCVARGVVPAAAKAFAGSAEVLGATALSLGLFGFAAVPFASASSFFFSSPSSGLIALIAFHFVSGFGLVIANFILSFIDSTADANEQLQPLYRLFPAFCLGDAFYTLAMRDATRALVGEGHEQNLLASDQLGAPLLALLAEGLVFGCATLALQYNEAAPLLPALAARLRRPRAPAAATGQSGASTGQSGAAAGQGGAAPAGGGGRSGARLVHETVPAGAFPEPSRNLPAGLEDESVLAERAAVAAGAAGGEGAAAGADGAKLVLRSLRKVFGPKVAVADLSLRIRTGECFGFLGTNGAGKSTTFAMLTGAVAPSSGDAALDGLSVRRDQASIRRRVGYCPQHDALEGLMTGRETLRMYARIKGVPPAAIEAEAEALLQDLDLAKFGDKPAGQYSGGNKRKLCVGVALAFAPGLPRFHEITRDHPRLGIALVGAPSLVLLDEPSSGMDAASKRFLWAAIKRRTADACTVLTSHSMEECEALCGRIGVMVEGRLRCVGSLQALKSRYGQGYKLDLRLQPEQAEAAVERVLAALRRQFDGVEVAEVEPPNLSLTVPQAGTPLSELFGALVALRESLPVQEASVTQCTLEQIFLLMASKAALRASGSAAA